MAKNEGDAYSRIPLRFDEAAASALQAYRTQVAATEAEATGLYLSWLGKLPGMAVRLAIILEHLRWCGDVRMRSHQRISPKWRPIAFLDGRRPHGAPLIW